MVKVSAIIMASGFSTRMEINKLFLEYQGMTFLDHVLNLIESMDFFEQILVISPENSQGCSFSKKVKVVLNHQAHQGQSASVRLGTEVASGDGYLYLPVDQPLVTVDILTALLAEYSIGNIVFPLLEGNKPSSPIYFGKKFRSELLKVTGSTGGREVRNRYPEAWCPVPITDSKRLLDIDTLAMYHYLVNDLFLEND